MSEGSQSSIVLQELLLSVAEELKLPLIQIARQAEQAEQGGPGSKSIRGTAETALRLLDNYALGVRLQLQPAQLEQEPVSVSSVLYDTGQQLDALAKNYGVELELNVAGRYGTVMAHRQGLQSALVSLGAALIEALPALESPRQLKLQLASHRSRYGIVAGLYADTPQLTNAALKRGRRLQSERVSRQPLTTISHTSGAGIFVADTILQAMHLRLRASRHHNLYGLGTVLPPNNQIALV
ncbi:MAG TPA: hypothetical protein VFH99_00530 [Candidatus Saccharimonadales bacterium]|nr:hypothetical protein [Candidatus Saccharimonadales bacterium]